MLRRKQEFECGSLAVSCRGKTIRSVNTPLTATQVNYSTRSPLGLPLIRHYLTAYYLPYTDPAGNIIYFESHLLTDGTHTLEIKVADAGDAYPFVLDEIACLIGYGGANNNITIGSPSTPTTAKPVGTIVGGVIGGIGVIGIIVILLVFVYCSPNRRARNNQDGDVVNPRVAETLASECLYRIRYLSQRERRELT